MTGTFIARHPLTTYCALTFAISWGGFVLVVGPGGFPGEGSQFDSLMPLVAAAILAGPSVTGILLTALLSGRADLRELLSRLLRWRVAARWYAAALVMIGIVVGLTTVFVGVAWGAWHLLQMLWISGTYAGTVPLILYVPLNVLGSVMQLTAYRVLMVRVHDPYRELVRGDAHAREPYNQHDLHLHARGDGGRIPVLRVDVGRRVVGGRRRRGLDQRWPFLTATA